MPDSSHDPAATPRAVNYRELFDAIDEGFCVVEMLFRDGEPTDYRFVEVNARFEDQTGLHNARGRRARELVPNLEAHWFDIYGRVALTGRSERFEEHSKAMNRWFDVYAFRIGEPGERRVAVFFRDISELRQAELALMQLTGELEHKVRVRTRQVQELAAQLTLSEVQERARLAQVLHDDLQQQLYAVGFALHELRPHLQVDAVGGQGFEEVKHLLEGAIATARTTTTNLSPPVLRHEGLGEAFVWLGNDMTSRHGLEVTVIAPPGIDVPNEAARVLVFGMVRELLFNVVKHAGIGKATVTLAQDERLFTATVQDLGRGFDLDPLEVGGSGLSSVRKRLELFGGRLELTSAPGEGTRVAIVLPASCLA